MRLSVASALEVRVLREKAKNGIDSRAAPLHCTNMNIRLSIDKAGRVVIPKPLRDELCLEPGDSLEMESTGEQITCVQSVGRDR